LHCAASAASHLNVIEYLVELRPESLQLASSNGYLPVHYAARAHCPLPSLRFLIELWPESVGVRIANGSLPLHLALDEGPSRETLQYGPSLETIQYLVELLPGSLTVANFHGSLPAHMAARHDTAGILTFLVNSSPETLLIADSSGSLPLHVAAGREGASSSEVVRCLVCRSQTLMERFLSTWQLVTTIVLPWCACWSGDHQRLCKQETWRGRYRCTLQSPDQTHR
jgi:ankyrin repeat protein